MSGGFGPNLKITRGSLFVRGTSPVEPDSKPDEVPLPPGAEAEAGRVDFAGDVLGLEGDPAADVVLTFVLSRRVIEVGGADAMGRREDDVDTDDVSKGSSIAIVRSSQGSAEPEAPREGLPPRRFFVNFSS